uniref:ABC transmembrane type-1 domain-containing protein n=1 Tax=Romanomermis culicivorax TaxID=13658 RepID=A0A915IRX7_ROMCU
SKFITPLLRLGFKKSLEPPDFYKVLAQDESRTLCYALEESWENEVNESKVKNRPAKLHNAIYFVFGRKYILLGSILVFEILTVSTSGLREMEAGKIMNLLSNDVARFDQTVIFLHYFWAAPLSLIGFVALLWYEMGPSCLAGFLGLIILVPIQAFMGRKMGYYRRQVATLSDKRIGIMNELLNGIRVIKMYAWEIPFSQLVDAIRIK